MGLVAVSSGIPCGGNMNHWGRESRRGRRKRKHSKKEEEEEKDGKREKEEEEEGRRGGWVACGSVGLLANVRCQMPRT